MPDHEYPTIGEFRGELIQHRHGACDAGASGFPAGERMLRRLPLESRPVFGERCREFCRRHALATSEVDLDQTGVDAKRQTCGFRGGFRGQPRSTQG
jgi:hypothetical protein